MRFVWGISLFLLACGAEPQKPSQSASSDPSSDVAATSEGETSLPNETVASSTLAAASAPTSDVTATSTGEESEARPPPAELSLELGDALKEAAVWDATTLTEKAQVPFEALGYGAEEAIGLDTIQSSDLGLSEAELAKYQENGFVISTRMTFPHFAYGYASIYAQDLPLFISADSILFALHSSYDAILKSIEESLLVPEVTTMLAAMRANLQAETAVTEAHHDVDMYLTVAQSLLLQELQAPTYPQNAQVVSDLYESCSAAMGARAISFFGAQRDFDFSQFKPRGHYNDSVQLQRYFRAMIWMGRVDLRLVDTDDAGESTLRQREASVAVLLRSLMNEQARRAHERVDALVRAFVGEHDSMTPSEVDALMRDLNVSSTSEFEALSDERVLEAVSSGGYGVQRISSQIMTGGLAGTAPLPSAFALFGQRYVIDSHVFSNVVFDRVKAGAVLRMMPNPLDVAYAALQNDQAALLLRSELEGYDYASDLASMRVVVDHEPRAFWRQNLYNRWLDALRTLSPARAMNVGAGQTLPQIARTEAWGRRLLNTQLASWAELRHDTILYVKQSYSAGSQCEYPDAYVDPYPEFFGAIAALAEHALTVLEEQGLSLHLQNAGGVNPLPSATLARTDLVLRSFVEVGGILQDMALRQRTGEPHSEQHMAFVNEAVSRNHNGCGSPDTHTGWYSDLFIDPVLEFAPTIADVHTQPTTESGSPVGRVLHVGTGEIRLMVTSIDTCSGPRAYAGLVSSYFERIETDWNRLDDAAWEKLLSAGDAVSPPWLTSLTAN